MEMLKSTVNDRLVEQQQDGDTGNTNAPNNNNNNNRLSVVCASCDLPILSNFVRQFGAVYHSECFCCNDCQKVVADRFFKFETDSGAVVALCETDYYKRKTLSCGKCGLALRKSYINALGQKFHLSCFTCSMCDTVFGPNDTYYEHDNKIYCHLHYSQKCAEPCGGCQIPILNQFVEVKADDFVEQWHPECYTVFKSWQIKMVEKGSVSISQIPHQSSAQVLQSASDLEDIKLREKLMFEKVNRICTVLSAFEESAAACISDMLLHVSNQSMIDAVCEAGNFILHVDALFAGLDDLNAEFGLFKDEIGLSYNKEPKMLSKKIVNFFSLLAHTQDSGLKQQGTVTQELLSLVTSLAQYLKILLRIGMSGALKLESLYNSKSAIGAFLNRLMEVGEQQFQDDDYDTSVGGGAFTIRFNSKFKLVDTDVKSDLCKSCKTSVEESCYRLGESRWHRKCMSCAVCRKNLADLLDQKVNDDVAFYDGVENRLLCSEHQSSQSKAGFVKVTQLQEYGFLLRVALKRLYSLLKIKDDSNMSTSQSQLARGSPRQEQLQSMDLINEKIDELAPLNDDEVPEFVPRPRSMVSEKAVRRLSLSLPDDTADVIPQNQRDSVDEQHAHGDNNNNINSSDQDGGNAAPLNKIKVADHIMSQHNLIEEYKDGMTIDVMPPKASAVAISSVKKYSQVDISSKALSSSLPELHQVGPVQRAKQDSNAAYPELNSQHATTSHSIAKAQGSGDSSKGSSTGVKDANGGRHLSELDALEQMTVFHLAMFKLQPFVADHYTPSELLDLVRKKGKAPFWSKILNTLKPVKKPSKSREGSFGVPLDVVVDKYGVESKHLGSQHYRPRIPIFMENAITCLKKLDLNIEGIFRKNGNIKNLHNLQDQVDLDPSYDLSAEGPIQIAALMKKFLREMPEPLIPFKLYKLMILAQSNPNPDQRRTMMHYLICTLPKANRDLLQVLLCFLRDIAQCKNNKMDLSNLAIVITPNIFYSNSKVAIANVTQKSGHAAITANQKEKDESLLDIETVKTLMAIQDGMWTVPEEFSEFIALNEINEGLSDLPAKDVLKKIEMLVGNRKGTTVVGSTKVNSNIAGNYSNVEQVSMSPVLNAQKLS
ncbi:hypothetical protein MIR68_009573 [Amoeboaphelidium protococcarum]|nr:hypothetical protein MIR68_009573 [Amoeboaphelidium protococcarum]